MHPKNRRGTSLLLILQAWIIPCHGFNWIPPYRGALSHAAHDHAQLGSVPTSRTGGRPTPGSIKGIPQLRMSQRDGTFYESFEDDYSSDREDEKVVEFCEGNGCRVKLNATLYRYLLSTFLHEATLVRCMISRLPQLERCEHFRPSLALLLEINTPRLMTVRGVLQC